MPSHTTSSALIKLYFLNGAPWGWPAWQERTNIPHGLFPANDDDLPPGWTRQSAIDVQSYFTAYNQLSSEGDKIKFAGRTKGGSTYPGRKIWATFVSRNYARWGIHNVIVTELKEWDVHPMTILIRENKTNDQWPCADFYIPKVIDSLALKLWGYEAFPDGTEVLTTDLRKCLQIFVQRSWNTVRVQVSGMRNRQDEVEAAAIAAFKDLEEGKPTRKKVTRAIRCVAKWKECAELFSTVDNLRKADEMLATLHTIMEALGAKIEKSKSKVVKSTCKVSTKALRDLATQEDISDLLLVYEEYLEMNVEEEDEPPITDISPEKNQLDQDEGDFGMEVESKMSAAGFTYRFGFPSGLPVQFNTLRHRSGVSPWDDPSPFEQDPIPDDLVNFYLHWHQLAGVHSIVRSLFTEEPDATHTTGVLVGDEVGLGKTAQAIALIGFLNQSILGVNRAVPRILRSTPYLGTYEGVPSLPHLILCPGTLVAQWVAELRLLFIPKSVDIFVYSGRDGDDFWGPTGGLQQSNQQLHNRIVVASHSALFNDFRKTHRGQSRKNARPWEIPPPKRSLTNTIFGQKFLTVIVDEAHHMRNPGNNHLATLRLLQQAKVKLIMTATPLHTAPKDIASMGRLVGLPHFSDEVSYIEEKADLAKLRRLKKPDDVEARRAEQLQIVRRLQGHCKGHFLRRTSQSVDDMGAPLLPLPPYEEIIGVLNLTERETAIMHERSEAAKAAVLSSSSTRIQTKKFYLEYRTAVGYAKEDPSDPWPSFDTLEQWNPMKSTKMDVCARICEHYLKRDDAMDVTFVEGEPVFPKAPDTSEVDDVKRNRRIIIYAEFPSMAPLLQNALLLYGVPSLAINGKISFDQRDKRVKELYSDKNTSRVLIFSSVGSAGLNLAIADIVIFFDQPWSAQDERQIRGRAHRQPQTETVKVIHLLANDSADLLMNDVARGKRDMFDAFVNKELGEELKTILAGCITDVDEKTGAEIEGGTHPVVAPPKKKTRSRKRKNLVQDDDDNDNEPAVKGDRDPAVPDNDNDMMATDDTLSGESSRASTTEPPDSASEFDNSDANGDKMEVDDPSPALQQMTLGGPGSEEPVVTGKGSGIDGRSGPGPGPIQNRGSKSPPSKRPRTDIATVTVPLGDITPEAGNPEGAHNTQSNDQPGAATPQPSSSAPNSGQGETSGTTKPKKPNPFARKSNSVEGHPARPVTESGAPSRQPGPLSAVTIPGKGSLKVGANFVKRRNERPTK